MMEKNKKTLKKLNAWSKMTLEEFLSQEGIETEPSHGVIKIKDNSLADFFSKNFAKDEYIEYRQSDEGRFFLKNPKFTVASAWEFVVYFGKYLSFLIYEVRYLPDKNTDDYKCTINSLAVDVLEKSSKFEVTSIPTGSYIIKRLM